MAVYTSINDSSAQFQTLLWTGDGNATRALTNTGNANLQPDWVWLKNRTDAENHTLADTSRGITKRVSSNNDAAEDSNGLVSVQSDGFTVSQSNNGNTNAKNYVAWQWKVNGGTETASQAESGSQIACSVQANTTAGISIITYTGTGGTGHTFLHGLGSTPAWHIIKRRSGTENWLVYHQNNTSDPATDHLLLDTGDATVDSATRYDDTSPNATEIACGNNAVINGDASTYVCYAFKEIKGYSKFGGYKGNSNADGTFVHTGFKPAWLMIKNISATQSWWIFDNKRPGYNGGDVRLRADRDTAESTGSRVDFVSNGFKWRDGDNAWNYEGNEFIYMCFAEHPFVSSEGIPVTAR